MIHIVQIANPAFSNYSGQDYGGDFHDGRSIVSETEYQRISGVIPLKKIQSFDADRIQTMLVEYEQLKRENEEMKQQISSHISEKSMTDSLDLDEIQLSKRASKRRVNTGEDA